MAETISPARAGYETAIATLRDVAQRTGSPAARWAADYLAADPDKRARAALEREAAPAQWLIWSHHHKMWFAPKGCGYRSQVTDAGRFALEDTTKWMGRGCYCCPVPEVVIPAPPAEVLSTVGQTGPWAAEQIRQATAARFEAGDINQHALARAASEVGT